MHSEKQNNKWYKRITQSTTSYLLEYYVMIGFLSYTIGIVIFVTALINGSIVDSIDSGSLDALLVNTAFLIVIAPLTVLLMRRTENEELNRPKRLKQELRKVIGYFASIIALLYSVGVAIYAVAGILFTVYGRDSVDIDYLPTLLVAALLLVALAKYVGSQRSIADDPVRRSISRSTPAIIGVIFLILLVAPLVITRSDSFNDDQTLEDLYDIAESVEVYARQNNEAPTRISVLDLDDDIIERSRDEGYIYRDAQYVEARASDSYNYINFELCANLGSAGTWTNAPYRYDYEDDASPLKYGARYNKGLNCFEYRSRLNFVSVPKINDLREEPPINPGININ